MAKMIQSLFSNLNFALFTKKKKVIKVCGITVIVIGNGLEKLSSNPFRSCLRFTLRYCQWQKPKSHCVDGASDTMIVSSSKGLEPSARCRG